MLAPDESLTGHLAKLRKGERQRQDTATAVQAAADQPTGAYQPVGAQRPAATQPAAAQQQPAAAQQSPAPPARTGGDTTSVIPPREQWNGARAAGAAGAGTVHAASGARRRAMIDSAVQTVRRTTEQAVTTVKGWPRNTQLAAAGGLAVVLVLSLVLLFSGGDDKASPDPIAGPSVAGTAPAAFDTQVHTDRRFTVNVPKGWNRKAAGDWVDYIDPDDKVRKVRILVESSKGTSSSFLGVVANGLRKGTSTCPNPYDQLSLTPATVAGLQAGVLEYTCGAGDAARHGRWGTVVRDGKAYSFYLITKESRYAESAMIFDEMVRSFNLAAA
jgi:hypothetical protein